MFKARFKHCILHASNQIAKLCACRVVTTIMIVTEWMNVFIYRTYFFCILSQGSLQFWLREIERQLVNSEKVFFFFIWTDIDTLLISPRHCPLMPNAFPVGRGHSYTDRNQNKNSEKLSDLGGTSTEFHRVYCKP